MNEDNLLTLYAINHDTNATFINKNKELTTIEFDRWANTKYNRTNKQLYFPEQLTENTGLIPYLQYISTLLTSPKIIKKIVCCIHRVKVYGSPPDYDYTITRLKAPQKKDLPFKYRFDPHIINTLKTILTKIFPNAIVVFKPYHHYTHAACGYYQAPKVFEECFIFSYDGSGDTLFQSRKEPKTAKELRKLKGLPYNTGILFYAKNFNKKYGIKYVKTFKPRRFGGPYTLISTRLKIKYPTGEVDFLCKQKANRRLAAPGKFMGYTAYGTPRENLAKVIFICSILTYL